MMILPVFKNSFFCDEGRTDGLRLKMFYEDHIVYSFLNVDDRFEGYTGVLHGGMIFGVLDVIIWYAIFIETKRICMTRHTEIDFLRPVRCGRPYIAKGRFLRIEDKDVYATAWVEDDAGTVYAKMEAIFREARDITRLEYIERFDFTDVSHETREYFYSILSED